MKDAVGGERAGEVPSNLRSGRLRMGKPTAGHTAGPTAEYIGGVEASPGTETSQYREEKKSNEIPLVVASERGMSPNRAGVIARRRCPRGVVGRHRTGLRSGREVSNPRVSRTALERQAKQGDSPVGKSARTSPMVFLSTTGHVESRGNLGGPPSKAKHPWRPIVHEYREGKVKRTPEGE